MDSSRLLHDICRLGGVCKRGEVDENEHTERSRIGADVES